MRNGGGLEAVEFVEGVVERGVSYEVVDIVVFCGEALLLVYEWGGAGEGVVYVANQFGITECFASQLL